MYPVFGVPISFAGIISMIIALGTIVSSLFSDVVTAKFGTGKVTVISVAMTALALLGFSVSNSMWMLCLIAIPYGLGAGCVDASLNNYVAVHYASRHMSWLHCMWALGASIGPYVMGAALSGGMAWNGGYLAISLIQVVLTAALFLSLPLWKKTGSESTADVPSKALTLKQTVAIPGAKEVMLGFFCYCALEQTAILWASSYLVMHHGLEADRAASLASLYFIGLTVGRFLSGFVTYKLSDTNMIRLGQGLILAGIAVMLLPIGVMGTMVGLVLAGLGCAPIYPCIIHSTPEHFGEEHSQALIGIQMASAYTGICVMPPLFGILANHISAGLFPWYMLALNALMYLMTEALNRKTAR
jgi:fucose permease